VPLVSYPFHDFLRTYIPRIKTYIHPARMCCNNVMDCKVSSRSFISCLFAPLTTIPTGNPGDPTATPRFVPSFPPIRGVSPRRRPCQRCFYHTTIHALPFPAQSP
jgi:hypothetical protein